MVAKHEINKQTHIIQVAKIKMQSWMCGITKCDKIHNEYVTQSIGVRRIAEKL